MCSFGAPYCSFDGYLCNQLLNSVFNNVVRQSEIGMSVVGWNVRLNFGSLENVFGG